MSDKLTREGRYAVLRDSKGNIVTKVLSKKNEREDWRAILRRLTNNGQDQFENMVDISNGKPLQVKLEDGRESEPIIPGVMARIAANQFLLEMMHGKAVAQTEMRKAEAETKLVEQFRSLSNKELDAIVFGTTPAIEALPDGTRTDEATDKPDVEPGPQVHTNELEP